MVELEGQLSNPGVKLKALLRSVRLGGASPCSDPLVPRQHVQRQVSTGELRERESNPVRSLWMPRRIRYTGLKRKPTQRSNAEPKENPCK
jgi:hypothetical protein